MPYNENEFRDSNINYLNKDFNQYRNTLIKYAKTYFPNTYKDFNETSPGMMLIEMASYVGDVMSFYIDQQYQEMLLPLAQERKNVVNIAKMLGYKVKPIIPAYVELTVKQTLPSTATLDSYDGDNIQPIFTDKALTIDKGMRIQSSNDSTIYFETLDILDFNASGSLEVDPEPSDYSVDSGLVNEYTLTRKVRAVSGETKTSTFDIGAPTKFQEVLLNETNVIDIISVYDSNGNRWYEVDYLAQDKVPLDVHYTQDDLRGTAYSDIGNVNTSEVVPVPYVLDYIQTSRRFIKETKSNNSTALIFGNGILRNGQSNLQTGFLQSLNAGITYAGQAEELSSFLNPLLGDSTATLGEVPSHTTLTVTYRVGGGIATNVPSGDLNTINSISYIGNVSSIPGDSTLTVTNESPAVGGNDTETLDEIRENSKAFFSTQNRCVTKDDYEARIVNMSSKFGNIAKVYVERVDVGGDEQGMIASEALQYVNNILGTFDNFLNWTLDNPEIPGGTNWNEILLNESNDFGWSPDGNNSSFDFNSDGSLDTLDVTTLQEGIQTRLGTVKTYILSYDNSKSLVGDPWSKTDFCNGCVGISTPDLIRQNIKTYLEQFRILTDEVDITDGYIVNFGVVFDVVAHKSAVKQQVKLACIEKIKSYFNIDKMQFRQPIFTSDLSYQLMGVDGVRAVNYVILTQDKNWITDPAGNTLVFERPLYDSILSSDGTVTARDTDQSGYGYQYSFGDFYTYELDGEQHPSITQGIDGVILPSKSPSVFELKNPDENIRGVVR